MTVIRTSMTVLNHKRSMLHSLVIKMCVNGQFSKIQSQLMFLNTLTNHTKSSQMTI